MNHIDLHTKYMTYCCGFLSGSKEGDAKVTPAKPGHKRSETKQQDNNDRGSEVTNTHMLSHLPRLHCCYHLERNESFAFLQFNVATLQSYVIMNRKVAL